MIRMQQRKLTDKACAAHEEAAEEAEEYGDEYGEYGDYGDENAEYEYESPREVVKAAETSEEEATGYYSHVKDKHFRRFLENNTLDTVFDLEDSPTSFKHVYLLDEEGIVPNEFGRQNESKYLASCS